jgi:hypothetical protein
MRRLLHATAVYAALLASETHAELLSGNQLYSICRNGLVGDDFCVGYIVGASEAWWKAKATLATTLGAGFGLAWCREEATNGQVTDVVVAFLRDHPELRDQPALDLVIEALSDAFPC